MKLQELLGKKLKDDLMLEVLEANQIEEVIYAFDRLHENSPDVYWASAKAAGFQLRFNQDQLLDTVFCYIVAEDGFAAIATDLIGVDCHASFADVEAYASSHSLTFSTSLPFKEHLGTASWIRIEGATTRTHYAFDNGQPHRITLSLAGS